jgi:hypothetical protein
MPRSASHNTGGHIADRRRIWWVIPFVVLMLWSNPAAPASPDGLKLPPDRAFDSRSDSPGAVNFSHATHVEFTDRNCLACHPSPFSILGRHQEVTAEAIPLPSGARG